MTKKITPIIMVIIFTMISCSDKMPLFEATLITKNDNPSLSFVPNMEFKKFNDSVAIYLEPLDFNKMLGSEIKKGVFIEKNDKFSVMVLLLTNYEGGKGAKYQMILRTYSKDLKIIDSYILANTVGNPLCSGVITKDLKIRKKCNDGSEVLAHIDRYGKFIKGAQ